MTLEKLFRSIFYWIVKRFISIATFKTDSLRFFIFQLPAFSLQQSVFGGLPNTPKQLTLDGNPNLTCDCDLKWVLDLDNPPSCRNPDTGTMENIKKLKASDEEIMNLRTKMCSSRWVCYLKKQLAGQESLLVLSSEPLFSIDIFCSTI